MEARSAIGGGKKDGTGEIERDISTDEIFSHDSISITHVIHGIRLIYAA
jgi:hypothetical protein